MTPLFHRRANLTLSSPLLSKYRLSLLLAQEPLALCLLPSLLLEGCFLPSPLVCPCPTHSLGIRLWLFLDSPTEMTCGSLTLRAWKLWFRTSLEIASTWIFLDAHPKPPLTPLGCKPFFTQHPWGSLSIHRGGPLGSIGGWGPSASMGGWGPLASIEVVRVHIRPCRPTQRTAMLWPHICRWRHADGQHLQMQPNLDLCVLGS